MDIEKKRGFIIRAVYCAILAALVFVVVKYGLSLLAPFALAGVFVYLLRKPTVYLSRKLRLPHKLTAMLVVLLFYIITGLLATWLIISISSGIPKAVALLPIIYSNYVEPTVYNLFASVENLVLQLDSSLIGMLQGIEEQFMQSLGTLIRQISTWAVSLVSNFAVALPGLFIKLVLMIISTFFMAMDYDILSNFLYRQLSKTSKALFLQIKHYVVGTLFVCIGSYAIIMFLTFVELSIGLSILQLKHAFLIAALISIFDILPVLGTGGIMIPWALIMLIQGDFFLGVGLLLVYMAITIIRNVVEPKIVGSQLGLHPVVTLASMFVGVQLLGVVGLFGFPIALSLLRYLNDNGSIRLFKTEAPHYDADVAERAAAQSRQEK